MHMQKMHVHLATIHASNDWWDVEACVYMFRPGRRTTARTPPDRSRTNGMVDG